MLVNICSQFLTQTILLHKLLIALLLEYSIGSHLSHESKLHSFLMVLGFCLFWDYQYHLLAQPLLMNLTLGGEGATIIRFIQVTFRPLSPHQLHAMHIIGVEHEQHMQIRVLLKIAIYFFLYSHILKYYTIISSGLTNGPLNVTSE